MKRKILLSVSNPQLRKFSVLLSGTLFSQVINFFLYLILSRLYGAEDFGRLSLFVSITSTLSVAATLQVSHLFYSEGNLDEVYELRSLSENVLNFTCIVLIPLICICGLFGAFPKLSYYLYLIPVSVFFFSKVENEKTFKNRIEEFKTSTYLIIFPRSVGNAAKILFYYVKLPGGLIWGELLGNALVFLFSKHSFKIDFAKMKKGLINHKGFFLKNLPSFFIQVAVQELVPIFMVSRFGLNLGGVYFLFDKFLLQPLIVIGTVIGNSQMSYLQTLDHETKRNFIFKILNVVFITTVPLVLLILGLEKSFVDTLNLSFLSENFELFKIIILFIPLKLLKGTIGLVYLNSKKWDSGIFVRSIQLIFLGCICLYIIFAQKSFYIFLWLVLLNEFVHDLWLLFVSLKKTNS